MGKKEEILGNIEENEILMFADGFDEAIVGVVYGHNKRIAYSFMMAVEILMRTMSYTEAIEYLYFNVLIDSDEYPIWIMDDFENTNEK